MGFPTKNDHFGVFWGCHHLRKHPYQLVQDFFLQQYHWCGTMMEFSRKMIRGFFHASVFFFRVIGTGVWNQNQGSKINLAKHITSRHVTSQKTRWWFQIFHFDMFIPFWGKIPILAGWICMRYLSFECLSFAVRISEKFWIEILNSCNSCHPWN